MYILVAEFLDSVLQSY